MVERWNSTPMEKIAQQNQVRRSGSLQAFDQEFCNQEWTSRELDAVPYGGNHLPKQFRHITKNEKLNQ